MSRRFDHLPDVEAFLAVVQKGSMTEAAVALSTTASVLSRAITRLEGRLGVQLMRRTTRQLHLTEAGRGYVEQAQAAFALIDGAERQLQGLGAPDTRVVGRVRLSVPTTYGHHRLPPMLARFRDAHPAVEVELGITNRNVDLVAEGYDLVIRLGQLPDSGLVVRRLEDARLKLVASPDYLRRHGTPRTLDDLHAHQLLPFVMPSTGRHGAWLFRVDGQQEEWTPNGALRVMDDVLGCVSLAEHGAGLCQTYDFIVAERLAVGRLVEVLPAHGGCTRPFSLLFAAHRHLPAATRALVDFLVAEAAGARAGVSA